MAAYLEVPEGVVQEWALNQEVGNGGKQRGRCASSQRAACVSVDALCLLPPFPRSVQRAARRPQGQLISPRQSIYLRNGGSPVARSYAFGIVLGCTAKSDPHQPELELAPRSTRLRVAPSQFAVPVFMHPRRNPRRSFAPLLILAKQMKRADVIWQARPKVANAERSTGATLKFRLIVLCAPGASRRSISSLTARNFLMTALGRSRTPFTYARA